LAPGWFQGPTGLSLAGDLVREDMTGELGGPGSQHSLEVSSDPQHWASITKES
jgi:hypothetical protein